MSIAKWSVLGLALTLGAFIARTDRARAGDPSQDATAARASTEGVGSLDFGAARRSAPEPPETELSAVGSSDGAADAAAARGAAMTAAVRGLPALARSADRAARPIGPLGAGDASSDSYATRARTGFAESGIPDRELETAHAGLQGQQ